MGDDSNARRPARVVARVRRLVRALPLAGGVAAVMALLTSVPGAVVEASSPPTSRYEVITPRASVMASTQGVTPYRVLFVGASITAGVGAPTPQDGYANVLAAEIAKKIRRPVALSVVARPGAVASMAQSWHVPGGQKMIIEHLVTNDFLKGTPLKRYETNEMRVLRRLRAGSPHAVMFCLGSWSAAGDINHQGVEASAYDTQVQADCRSVHGTYVELAPLFQQAKLHDPSPKLTLAGPDRAFHPNSQGHVQIANAIMRQVDVDTMLPPETHLPGRPSPPPSPPPASAAAAEAGGAEPENGLPT